MKSLNINWLDWAILIVFICMCGADVFLYFFLSILKVLLFTNQWNNPFDFVKFITESNFVLFGIPWVSKILFLLVGIVPTIILVVFLKQTPIPACVRTIICLFIYWLTLLLFSSYIFWICVASVLIFTTILFIVLHIQRKKKDAEEKVQ